MTNVTVTVTEIVDGISAESTPTSITVYDGVFVDSGGGGGTGAVDSVNGHTGTVVLTASDVSAQPVDSDLTAIAALSTTTFGRALLALADAASLRTTAGLGTAATQASTAFDAAGAAAAAQAASQPLDSDLTAIAALSTTTFGRSLLTAADAAAARTTLGAGTSSFDGAYSSLTGKPTLGTAAAKDIPATGDASSTQVVYGTDTRLTDARTPTAHASSHASAGSDPVTLAASQIGSGTVATARLGSGTADSTKFLRGDQTWATPSGGGTVTSVTAGDSTVTVGGTSADPTIAVNAIAESQVTNLTTDLAAKAPLASPTFTGTPAAPTATGGTNTTQIATTAFVASATSSLAPLASPALTGSPTVPTQTAGDNSTKAASTAYVDARAATVPINAQTGTTYTLVLADAGKFVTMTNASASTLTVPPNSSVAFPVGTMIDGAQLGAGQVTLTPGSGVTVNGTPGLKVAAQYGTFALLKTATDTWLAMGRLSA